MIYLSVTYCTVALLKKRTYTVPAEGALLTHVLAELNANDSEVLSTDGASMYILASKLS